MNCPACGHAYCECIDLELKMTRSCLELDGKPCDAMVAKAAEFAYRRHPTFFAGTPIPWCDLGESVKEKIRQEFRGFCQT
jgi:hypothetical protein